MKGKNIVIAQDRLSLLGGITTVNRILGRAFEEAGYNVSYLALYDNTGDNPDAVTPDFVIRSGSLVSKTTHNKLVYNNPGPLNAVLTAKRRLPRCGTVTTRCAPAATCAHWVKIPLF